MPLGWRRADGAVPSVCSRDIFLHYVDSFRRPPHSDSVRCTGDEGVSETVIAAL